MESYFIIWLKESAGAVSILHSDKHFYRDFISCRGCNFVTYKTRAAAEKKARTYSYNKDGVIIAVSSSEYEQISEDFRRDRRAVLARYRGGEDLPAFEDAQPDTNGVVTCRIKAAAGITAGARLFDALLSTRDVNGWGPCVLLITYRKYYDNNGKFSGVPVFVIRPDDLPNMRPEKLFNMLNGNGTFADKLAGVIDWETRLSWLEAFTDEEKRAAVLIEKHLQTLASSNAA